MNHSPLVFLAAFFALAASWFGFVLTPQIQIGREQPGTNTVNTANLYPQARPGQARQGLDVYRAEGCAACHTEQVGQTATVCDVVLTDAGTNQAALVAALVKAGLGRSNPGQFLSGLPKPVVEAVDLDRGWGKRRSVARDYLYDDPVMLGSLRVGPDLANAGARLPDPNWHLRHLYAPRSEVKDSLMPPYRYLFERRRIGWQPSPDALQFPKELAPPPGFEIVPKPEARLLVAYLLSLRAETPLFEAPLTVPSAPAK